MIERRMTLEEACVVLASASAAERGTLFMLLYEQHGMGWFVVDDPGYRAAMREEYGWGGMMVFRGHWAELVSLAKAVPREIF